MGRAFIVNWLRFIPFGQHCYFSCPIEPKAGAPMDKDRRKFRCGFNRLPIHSSSFNCGAVFVALQLRRIGYWISVRSCVSHNPRLPSIKTVISLSSAPYFSGLTAK